MPWLAGEQATGAWTVDGAAGRLHAAEILELKVVDAEKLRAIREGDEH